MARIRVSEFVALPPKALIPILEVIIVIQSAG
jgi:hypothetical protein